MVYDQDRSRDKRLNSAEFKTRESQKKFSRTHTSEHSKYRRSSSRQERKVSKPEFDDARLFCDHCNQYYDNICPYHKQMYIPDRKVRCKYFSILFNVDSFRYQNPQLHNHIIDRI